MTIHIVTDSASDISLEEAKELGIEIVPLSVRFGEAEYTDLIDLSVSDFYQKMSESDLLPSTAAPSPGAFEAAFKRCIEAGAEGVVCINLSLALSATGQAAQLAADALVDTITVKCIDSKSITSGLGTIIRKAASAAKAGKSMDEIVSLVEGLASKTRIFATLDTLENLKKGGRIGGAKAMVGTMLQFKPCLDLSSGEVVEAGRQRTRKKSLMWLKEVLENLVLGAKEHLGPWPAELYRPPGVGVGVGVGVGCEVRAPMSDEPMRKVVRVVGSWGCCRSDAARAAQPRAPG